MADLQAGDEEFEAAYPELFRRAASMAFRLLGSREAAEDVAAEALARAYARWPKVGPLPYRDGWVLRVATNLALDAARRRPPPVTATEPVDPSDAATLRLALHAALRSLSSRQRQAVVLRFLCGLSEAETADALGTSVGTAHTHIHRGLRVMRSRLGDHFTYQGLNG